MNSVHYMSEKHNWETPPDLFNALDDEFGFTVDVCAEKETAKCAKYYTKEDDALGLNWRGVCWMNPPYGRVIGKWMMKAHEESKKGATVVCLIPSRTDTSWWWEYVMTHEVRFIRGRVKFWQNGKPANSAPFPSAIVIMRPSDGN